MSDNPYQSPGEAEAHFDPRDRLARLFRQVTICRWVILAALVVQGIAYFCFFIESPVVFGMAILGYAVAAVVGAFAIAWFLFRIDRPGSGIFLALLALSPILAFMAFSMFYVLEWFLPIIYTFLYLFMPLIGCSAMYIAQQLGAQALNRIKNDASFVGTDHLPS